MTTFFWHKIAEERIRESMDRGDLDDLPGMGSPQEMVDDSNVAEELRLAHHMLKNAGYTPPELDIRKEIHQVEDLLESAPDEQERYRALKRLNYLTMKLGSISPTSALFEERCYQAQVVDRLQRKKQ